MVIAMIAKIKGAATNVKEVAILSTIFRAKTNAQVSMEFINLK